MEVKQERGTEWNSEGNEMMNDNRRMLKEKKIKDIVLEYLKGPTTKNY